MIVSTLLHVDGQPERRPWAWALIPIVLLLAYQAPRIAGLSPSFGYLAQIALGVWMTRRFGGHGLAAFAVGCLLVSVPIGGSWGRLGNTATDNLVAVFVAWLAADRDRSPIDSILERAAVVRQWAVFWPFLALGLFDLSMSLLLDAAEAAPRLSLWLDGMRVLMLLTLMLGLADAGRRLFTALLLLLAVVLVGDIAHMAACAEDMLPEMACPTLLSLGGETYRISVDLALRADRTLPMLGGLAAAYGIGIYLRRLVRGEEMRHLLLQAPAKLGLVLLVLGIGFGRYSAFPLADRFSLVFAGSYPVMLAGALLLGSRLGYRGVAIVAAVYLVTVQVPGLIDWRPESEPFPFRLSVGLLLDCALAALIGAAFRFRRRVTLDAPRRFETVTLFAALWTLLLGLVDLESGTSWMWLMAATLAAALIVLAIRFREERARVAGLAVTRLADLLIVVAVLVFVKEHVPGIVEALLNLGGSLRSLATGTEISGVEAMLLRARLIPIQAWLFFLFLLLLVDGFVLYSRVRGMVRALPALMRTLSRRASSGPTAGPATGPGGSREPD